MRGNVSVNNLTAPYMYSTAGDIGGFQSYYSPFMDAATITGFSDLIPQLSASSTAADIIGTYPALNPTSVFTNIFIDLYVLDPEGWANGIAFVLPALTDNTTFTNGFPGGRTFLGTFVDNGPLDRDPAVGSFNFNAAALGLAAGTQVTIAANYSVDKAGTHNGRMTTSNFSNPQTLRAPIVITGVTRTSSNVTITWTGGTAPYTLQRRTQLNTGSWTTVQTSLPGPSTTYADALATPAYYQVLGN